MANIHEWKIGQSGALLQGTNVILMRETNIEGVPLTNLRMQFVRVGLSVTPLSLRCCALSCLVRQLMPTIPHAGRVLSAGELSNEELGILKG